ncbi:MAG: 30S ribosomal protein S4e [Thermoplasmata archaeon]|nr:30S ribosomal protein S4e [Thermoplasmata archaeon]
MSKHMKRLTAPKSWGISRKKTKWVAKPTPGPHATEASVPMVILLRDILKICDNTREARHILGAREIMVDGRTVMEEKFPVGLMDIVTIAKSGENYRVLMDTHGRLKLIAISAEEAKTKLVRIENKTIVKNGVFQLNMHDGRNILLPKNQYKTGDVLKIEIPSQKIVKQLPLKEGSLALLIAGSHPGSLVTVDSFEVKRGSAQNLIAFKEGFATVWENVFVVGEKTPEIKMPEGSAI